MTSKRIRLTICGGGNGAHTLAGVASSLTDVDVTVFDVFEDEQERWSASMIEHGFMVHFAKTGHVLRHDPGTPFQVTKTVPETLSESDIVVICLPAYAHRLYLSLIAPVVRDDCIIVGMPGQFGFELDAMKILEEHKKKCTIMGVETLPWACRIAQYGKEVVVQGTKDSVCVFVAQRNKDSRNPEATLQHLLGSAPIVTRMNTFLEMSLVSMSILHPPLMYSRWKDWDGEEIEKAPLFYQGVTEKCVGYLSGVTEEVLEMCSAFSHLLPTVDFSQVSPTHKWLIDHYGDQIDDQSTLLTSLRTNRAYNALVHPCKKIDIGKVVPDFQYRYLREDIPYGLVGLRALADIVNVKTPVMDAIISWAQEKLQKEYLVDGKLDGKDIGETRIAQCYGYTTAEQLQSLSDA